MDEQKARLWPGWDDMAIVLGNMIPWLIVGMIFAAVYIIVYIWGVPTN